MLYFLSKLAFYCGSKRSLNSGFGGFPVLNFNLGRFGPVYAWRKPLSLLQANNKLHAYEIHQGNFFV